MGHFDQRIRPSVGGDHVEIRPITNALSTLEQRLACFDPAQHGGEAMVPSQVLGAEGGKSWGDFS